MLGKAKDAKKKKTTKKANTPKKGEVWKDVANNLLGRGANEGSAIRQANAAGRVGAGRQTLQE